MKSCAIIGSTKIAEIHAREFLKNGIKDITLVSRNLNKSKKFAKNLSLKFNDKIKFSNHQIFQKKNFDMISICSNTKFHLTNIKKLQNIKSKILVEKPLIPLKNVDNIYSSLNSIYSKNRNIFVSYPMYYLTYFFLKNFKFNNKIKSISVYYQTRGKKSGSEIFFDLAPHVLIVIMLLLKRKLKKIVILRKNVKQESFIVSFKSYNIKNEIKLLQLKNRKKSIFKFKINNHSIKRSTKIINNVFSNYLEYKNKKIFMENPMSNVIKNFIKHNYKTNVYKINKNITYNLSILTKNIYDQTI